jgi:uncharacterized protein (TIGR04255 family)
MGEKLKSAPVYFAIAQARHNTVLRLGSYAADIQDRMRKAGYPDFQKAVSMAFNLMPQIGEEKHTQNQPRVEQVERLIFSSSDYSKGFIVEQNALSFQTTEYDTFETFADEFSKGLGIIHECITLAHSERVGLRYLDAIVPLNGEAGLGDYLVPGVLGLGNNLPDSVEVSRSFTETHIRTAECVILARTIIQAGPLGFPMDLQPMGVKIAERFQSINGVHAIIDTDASIEGRHTFDVDAIKAQLRKLRNGVGLAFDAIVTPSAIAEWKI